MPESEGSYQRAPSQQLFLWGQSVFIIAQLLTAGLLHINELDPIRRYLPSYNRPRKGGRYSAFQVRPVRTIYLGINKIGEKKLNNIIIGNTSTYFSLNLNNFSYSLYLCLFCTNHKKCRPNQEL